MSSRREFWVVTFLTLLAFLLRLADLDGRSLWLDENFTLLRIYGTWSDIVNNIVIRQDSIHTTDVNPSVYFALLKLWVHAAGESAFVLRLFSAIFIILVVPSSYILGRYLAKSRSVGLMSAGLALFSPSYQWYTSEIRAYSLLLFLGIINLYLLLKILYSLRKLIIILLWILTSIIIVFVHYSSISLVVAQVIWLLGTRRITLYKLDTVGTIKILSIAIIILFVLAISSPFWTPTQRFTIQLATQALTTPSGQGISLIGWLTEIISALAFGFNAGDPTGTSGLLTALIGLVIIVGLNLGLDRQSKFLLYSVIFTPIIFWFILSFFIENRPSFRYIIFIFPFLSICQANMLVRLGAALKKWPLLGLALRIGSAVLIFGSAVFGTAMTFVRTPTWQDNWRAVADYLRQNWRPGDVLAINLYTPELVLDIYLGDVPIEIIPVHTWLQIPAEEAHRVIGARYQRIWYVNTGGDGGIQNPEAQALLSRYLLRSRTSFPARTNIIELLEYDLQPFVSDHLPAQALPTASENIGQTRIAGYEITDGNLYHPYPNFWLNLYWQRGHADEDLTRHAVALRLYDAQTNWWDWSVSANLAPWPADWERGRIYRTSHVIPLPLGLPLQPYQLELRLLAGPKGETIQVAKVAIDEQTTRCCLRVKQWPGRRERDRQQLTDVALSAEYPSVRRPNQPLPVVLTWYPAEPNTPAWQTRLKVEGLLGGEIVTLEQATGTPAFPVTAWPAGEPTRDPYTLALPPTISPGVYRLSLERWREDRKVDGLLLGLLRVEDYPRSPVAERIQHLSNARVGELQLLGYSANGRPQRGKVSDFITHWRIAEAPKHDGVIFLHLLDAQGRLISQDDNPPIVDGLVRSTITYRPGEGINQLHRLEIPAGLLPGQYQLYAGVYDRQSMARWPAQQDGQPARDNLVFLGTITIE